MHVNLHETCIELSMELPASNTEEHRKKIQNVHKTIRVADVTALIVKHKLEDDEEEITEKNGISVGVKAKNSWMNFTESMPKCLWQIHIFTK